MEDLRCPDCGYKGQLYYKKKTDSFRCSKCGKESTAKEVRDNGGNK